MTTHPSLESTVVQQSPSLGQAVALLDLMGAGQWAQLTEAIEEVKAAGHGEVRLVFEDGHPRLLFVTVARLYVSFDQVLPALVAVQRAREGNVAVIVRNSRSTRIEVTTQAKMIAPAPPKRLV